MYSPSQGGILLVPLYPATHSPEAGQPPVHAAESCCMEHQGSLHQQVDSGLQESTVPQNSSSAVQQQGLLRVGCALLPKKVSRYLTPAMKAVALSQGVELLLIDPTRSLHEQGPFHAIIHKLRPNPVWERNLQDYCQRHPNVTVIDRVDGIRTLQNRSTMLNPLQGDGVLIQDDGQPTAVRVQAPQQVEIPEGVTLAAAQQMLEAAGLQPPLLVKPLWTDGREGSHGLAVLHDLQALGRLLEGQVSSDLQPPLVVQQFVEHGGVLFKVYVVGDKTIVSTRPSLGDKYLGQAARKQGVLPLPRISCTRKYSQHQQSANQAIGKQHIAPAVPEQQSHCAANGAARQPPEWVTSALAAELRARLGLQLFNFDLICPQEEPAAAAGNSNDDSPGVGVEAGAQHGSSGDVETGGPQQEVQLYVVDINYFPGIDKIPNFEQVFVAFLKDACTRAEQQHNPTCQPCR